MGSYKRPIGGADRGKAIELSPEKKTELAVQQAVSKMGDESDISYVTFISVQNVEFKPAGSLLNKHYQNNHYTANGTAKIQIRNALKDELKPEKLVSYRIEFQDTLDSQGIPDLKINKFKAE